LEIDSHVGEEEGDVLEISQPTYQSSRSSRAAKTVVFTLTIKSVEKETAGLG
jgi:hypothetical protein